MTIDDPTMTIEQRTACRAWVNRFVAALRKNNLDGCPYINTETGGIDGYFDLIGVASDMLQGEPHDH